VKEGESRKGVKRVDKRGDWMWGRGEEESKRKSNTGRRVDGGIKDRGGGGGEG